MDRVTTEEPRSPASASTRLYHEFPLRLRWALLIVVIFHGALLAAGSYQGTYDAYVHMFLGDHYARDWFSTWEQRWYTGFTTVSYPPGTHMAIAAVSKITGSLAAAFVVIQTAVLLLLTVGIYRFSRIWVDQRAAANAALLLAVSSSIAETVHLFGQLPTTFALAFLLNAIPYIRAWIFGGQKRDLLTGVLVLAACTAGHHVTTLFGSIFFLGPVIVAGLLAQSRIPRPNEALRSQIRIEGTVWQALVKRRVLRVLPAVGRLAVVGPMLIATLVIVVLPYWLWSGSDPINQVPIPHGSRANFLEDRNLGLVFFIIPWGLLLLLVPYGIIRALADRMWPLAASIGLLFILGTGGTTPIPKLLLGPAFDILTLDRFTFWATIQILPLAGLFVSSVEDGAIATWLNQTGGRLLLRSTQVLGVVAVVGFALFSANLASLRPFQPAPIDTDPIVAFIEKDQHERWRFLTLGFGDQMAALSAATTATQVDGNYHSARRLPELTSTSVERLEGAKYRGISGLGSLQQFLEVPEKYHLKFVFSNDDFYDPLLHVLGWERLGPLENGIEVWEKADIEPLPATLPVREVPPWQRLMWGTVPPLAIISGLALLLWRAAFVRPDELHIDRVDLDTQSDSPIIALVRAWLQRTPTPTRRTTRRLVLAGGVIAFALIFGLRTMSSPSAEETVESYYDHLDFRRWTEAYDLLDEKTRPSYELWRLQFSVNGGLLSSFAKLDSVSSELVQEQGNQAVVQTELTYLTALDWYEVDHNHDVVKRDGDWRLLAEEPELTVPPDQFVRRAAVDWSIQGRRRATALTTELTDVQDRPEIDVVGVRLLESEGLPVVTGWVSNRDVDPADITLTAVLRDEAGNTLARYNATDRLLRSLNPRESTPFQIDFQRVAAGANLDFDPLDVQPVELTADVASLEVYAKAVVTTRGLYRGLGVNNLEASRTDAGDLQLSGTLRNDGVLEAVVPTLIISFLDNNGDVLWVERQFVEQSVRSQRSVDFAFVLDAAGLGEVALDRTAAIRDSKIVPKIYANGIDDRRVEIHRAAGLITLDDSSQIGSIRVDVATMLAPAVLK